MGGCELSAQSPTEEGDLRLNGPWSRAWSTGSIREAEFSHEGQELRHLQELKRGILSTEDSPHPWVVGVEMELGGQGASAVFLSALTLLWLPSGEVLRGFTFFLSS